MKHVLLKHAETTNFCRWPAGDRIQLVTSTASVDGTTVSVVDYDQSGAGKVWKEKRGETYTPD